MDIQQLLERSVLAKASDLHISAGSPPLMRVDGEVIKAANDILSADDVKQMLLGIMLEHQQSEFTESLETDFAYEVQGLARFRVNAFHQQRGPAAAFRTIPDRVLTLEELDAPEVLKDLSELHRGLVLVTGPTGSGKSTTLAAMVNHINERRQQHILTIEDPIEFVHHNKRSLVNQREVHRDTLSFNAALRSALREDPDVILVGELRDLETIRLAMTAAETGHLVFATLHTTSAPKTIDRIIDVFPGDEKSMVRSMLSESLRAVVSQLLLKRPGGGRVAAHEIMIATPAIKNLVREDKVAQMYSAIQTGAAHGMQTMEQALMRLRQRNLVDEEAVQRILGKQTQHGM
ncbi:type IV pilus twitching motility protein PilT [Aliidiomarina maris]|uniref:Pilus retraction ATPase PilT n=1 Tax=Aliidiomarina maris TaxID=531312 RepID=A0A327WUV9_9GAMM|nr:type IV pilus twitching motility protein PilT [Aliidiomarina maris]MBA3987814.1 twitching motility protein PilT [Idiomarina sp.]MCL5051230.1 type IV pilus twitching motility protein PilT [Bacillota bacterium]RAJ95235.1 pilus retraction ATPase PilT [Aliidiomarina maris]RUO21067.1 twitching motility protein PilT [Aliidiomarina maris]